MSHLPVGRSLIAAALSLALAAPAASASTLPSSNTPLAGSNFQGGDGNQDDAAPFIDWQALQAAGRVVHVPDPNAEDTAFTGGSKVLRPGEWQRTVEQGGVQPAKVNVLDVWSAVDQSGSQTFLYLASARADGSGTATITFELNRDQRLWDNGRTRIPCRTTGDLLVSTVPQGNRVDLTLSEWITVEADPATGCAKTGRIESRATIPADAAQGAVNSAPITSRLPGAFAVGSQIPTSQFSEVALNLTALLGEIFDDQCFAFGSLWAHSRSSNSDSSNLQDFVAPQPVDVRRCSASGTKFFDLDADGVRDPDDPGIPRFLIWADYDDDGVRDPGEPFSVTDDDGRYVIDDIRPPSGTYRLREELAPIGRRRTNTAWRCSFPNATTPGGFPNGRGGLFGCGWGPITVATTPDATGRDFGNWVPGSLTIEKQLWPADDPGRFDLSVNGVTVVAAAGDGDSITIPVAPGTYDIRESPVAGTDPANYTSTVQCRATTTRRSTRRPGEVWTELVLQAGAEASCTFINVRKGPVPVPAIDIEKTGPRYVEAGETVHYRLYVTNPGQVPIAADDLEVADQTCDDPPRLTSKNDDPTPRTLDPGDTWTYACAHATRRPGADCQDTTLRNTAVATGRVDGTTVTDDGSISTTIGCPDVPPQPPLPPEPGPTPPLVPPSPGASPSEPPFVPPGPEPPRGGVAGAAAVSVGGRRCITRVSQIRFFGRRVSKIAVSVDGRRLSTRKLRLLQRRVIPLTRLFPPGRYRLRIRVTYEPGSGTAPVTLTRTVVVCGRARAPRVTG